MLLAIDVGNTNVTIGVFDGSRLVHNWRLAALRERTADELGIFVTRLFEQTKVDIGSVSGIAVASVVPPLTRPMEEMCERSALYLLGNDPVLPRTALPAQYGAAAVPIGPDAINDGSTRQDGAAPETDDEENPEARYHQALCERT